MASKKTFSYTWWGKKWIQALESFGWANRLERGRRYARQGKVIDLNIEKGKITAFVSGTRSTPYRVSIKVQKFRKSQWNAIIKFLSSKALYAAQLLSGTMPEDIQYVFEEAGINILPHDEAELKVSCSCPDIAVPCKHIAAVHYIIAEELDKDPFLVFKLRGMGKEEFIEQMTKLNTKKYKKFNKTTIAPNKEKTLFPTVAIISNLQDLLTDEFWEGKKPKIEQSTIPGIHAAAFINDGDAFWSKDFPMAEIMQGIYRGSSKD